MKAVMLLGLPNTSGGCIVVTFVENQIVKHDTQSIFLKNKNFIQTLQEMYWQDFWSGQIDIKLQTNISGAFVNLSP